MTASAETNPIEPAAPSGPVDFPLRGQAQISVVILTLNEEINIRDCLDSCDWCDDVHVLDSGSIDRTCEIATQYGAAIHHHPFESFGAQRNWAIDNIHCKYEWIFHLDADERFTPELVHEMRSVIEGNPSDAGFYVPSKLIFMGRWLRRCAGYPTYQMRLFHCERMRFRDYGHGQREDTTGHIGTLQTPYLHHNLSKGLAEWLAKHDRYSTLEAKQAILSKHEPLRVWEILSRDRVKRLRAWKRLWYRMPLRPTARWFATMFMRGGILEGTAGRTYARLVGMYEEMSCLKERVLWAEAEREKQHPHDHTGHA